MSADSATVGTSPSPNTTIPPQEPAQEQAAPAPTTADIAHQPTQQAASEIDTMAASSATSTTTTARSWNVANTASSTPPRHDLRSIMQEEQEKQQQQQQQDERNQQQPKLHEASLQEQEEEMLRMALEQSLQTITIDPNDLQYSAHSTDHVAPAAAAAALPDNEHLTEEEIRQIRQALEESERGEASSIASFWSPAQLSPTKTPASTVASKLPPVPSIVNEEEDKHDPHVDAKPTAKPTPTKPQPTDTSVNWEAAAQHLSPEELQQIQLALGQQPNVDLPPPTGKDAVTAEERAAVERAIAEADAAAEAESYHVALQIAREEMAPLAEIARLHPSHQPQGHVRVVTRAQLAVESTGHDPGAFYESKPPPPHPDDLDCRHYDTPAAGFRMNAATPHAWTRRDAHTVIGPDAEVRTKHDSELHARANAHRLALDADEAVVGNTAFNRFHNSMKQRNRTKGVAAHGTGRAGADADGVKGGAMDAHVREIVQKALNQGWIAKLHGAVKEGKEALVYYAEQGELSGGRDVAVKVFKRIQEFKGRGSYVDGDPRYATVAYGKASAREQLAIWTEKEFRNLVRANRAGVPVATPLHHKDNVLLMRFLGQDGWPAPQLRELDLRKGSSRWTTFYEQVMQSMHLLYQKARLIHGDLSEYNILAVPAYLVDNPMVVDTEVELQAVLIDFGQAVDVRHADAEYLLRRDLTRVASFFSRQGVATMSVNDAFLFCTLPVKKEAKEENQEALTDA